MGTYRAALRLVESVQLREQFLNRALVADLAREKGSVMEVMARLLRCLDYFHLKFAGSSESARFASAERPVVLVQHSCVLRVVDLIGYD